MVNFNREFLTVEELANQLGVPKSWVYHRTSEGTIPFYKFGKYLRFKKDDVDNYFKNGEN